MDALLTIRRFQLYTYFWALPSYYEVGGKIYTSSIIIPRMTIFHQEKICEVGGTLNYGVIQLATSKKLPIAVDAR